MVKRLGTTGLLGKLRLVVRLGRGKACVLAIFMTFDCIFGVFMIKSAVWATNGYDFSEF